MRTTVTLEPDVAARLKAPTGPSSSRMGASTVEIPSSHVAMVSHPGEVAQLIKTAAEAVPTAT